MVRGPSAYFVFCAEKRAEARAHVEAATEPGSKVSVATVAKRLGQLWQGLPDEKKQRCGALFQDVTFISNPNCSNPAPHKQVAPMSGHGGIGP